MKCTNCGAELNINAKFCNNCGKEVTIAQRMVLNVCPNCGAGTKPGTMFCTSCGEDLRRDTAVQSPSGANADALIKRGYMALEDGMFDEAEGFFERVLDMDAECAKAYFGLVLFDFKAKDINDLKNILMAKDKKAEKELIIIGDMAAEKEKIISENIVPNCLEREQLEALLNFDCSYASITPYLEKMKAYVVSKIEGNRHFGRAIIYAGGDLKGEFESIKKEVIQSYDERIGQSEEADKKAAKIIENEYKVRIDSVRNKCQAAKESAERAREEKYNEAVAMFEKGEYEEAAALFEAEEIIDYKDSRDYIQKCEEKIGFVCYSEKANEGCIKAIAVAVIIAFAIFFAYLVTNN